MLRVTRFFKRVSDVNKLEATDSSTELPVSQQLKMVTFRVDSSVGVGSALVNTGG